MVRKPNVSRRTLLTAVGGTALAGGVVAAVVTTDDDAPGAGPADPTDTETPTDEPTPTDTETPTDEPTPTDTETPPPPESTYVLEQGGETVPLVPFTGFESARAMYDYRLPERFASRENGASVTDNPKYSSEGTVDLQRVETSIMFLYDGPDGVSLVFVHGKLGEGTLGAAATFSLSGVPPGAEWVVTDDLYRDPATGEVHPSNYDNWFVGETQHVIDWTWNGDRTDGGVLRGLDVEDLALTVDPAFNEEAALYEAQYEGDVRDWQVLSGDRSDPDRTSLDMSSQVTIRPAESGDG